VFNSDLIFVLGSNGEMKERKINRPTRYLAAWSSVSTGIGESVLDWKLREQRMSEMNERLNDGVKGSGIG
jgi:hypothetical protein